MPLYDFSCAGGHTTERLASMATEAVACFCGRKAKRQAVYSHASPRTWASEFEVPTSAREALAEVTGWKREAMAAKEEAVKNGWKAQE